MTVTTSLGSLNLISLAIPIFLELVFNNLIGTVSTAVLSGYSEEAVAATGSVNILFSLFIAFFSSVCTGASVIISNLIGAEKLSKAEKACWSSLLLCGGLSLVIAICVFAMSPLIGGWMKLTGIVYEMAVAYLRIRISALVIQVLCMILLAQLRCYGFPKCTVVIGMITNVCNLVFSIYAVNYAVHPALSGVNGVAWGNVLSQVIGFGIAFAVFRRRKLRLHRTDTARECAGMMGQVLRIGVPSSISNASFLLAQLITNSFAVMMGIYAVSGKIYFTNILCYAFLISSGVGNANSLLIGRLCGAGRYEHAKKLNAMLVKFTIPANFLVSLFIILFRVPILSMFTDNVAIFEMALGILMVDLVVEQARAISQIYEYALRSAGHVTWTMIVTLISCWVFSVGLAYYLSIPCGMGLVGCWIGLALDEWIRTGFTYFYWKSGIWIPKNRANTEG